jgi:hypothetical protein
MNQETQGYSLMKKTEGKKSRDTVPLKISIKNKKRQQLSGFDSVGLAPNQVE